MLDKANYDKNIALPRVRGGKNHLPSPTGKSTNPPPATNYRLMGNGKFSKGGRNRFA
jgi:hypothetical protein